MSLAQEINDQGKLAEDAGLTGDYVTAIRHLEAAILKINRMPTQSDELARIEYDKQGLVDMLEHFQKKANAQNLRGRGHIQRTKHRFV